MMVDGLACSEAARAGPADAAGRQSGAAPLVCSTQGDWAAEKPAKRSLTFAPALAAVEVPRRFLRGMRCGSSTSTT